MEAPPSGDWTDWCTCGGGVEWSGVECTQHYYVSHAETTTLTTTTTYWRRDMTGASNLNKFVLEAGPEDCIVKCRITRNCKGLDKGGWVGGMPVTAETARI